MWGGFLYPLRAAECALPLTRNTRAYNAMVSYLLSPLFLGTTAGPGTDDFVLHEIQEIEATRRQIVADARVLSKSW